jgi:enamine deaminase RidA (YjgF/YER057c/UK114 family)
MRLRIGLVVAASLAVGACSSAVLPPHIVRAGAATVPIAASVAVPHGSRIIYVSGTVPEASDTSAPEGSVQRYGSTEAQTRSILAKIGTILNEQGAGFGDIVMMRVFLVAPPGQSRMDFAGMMKAYSEQFGTSAQPLKPARSTMQVAGLVNPGWLVEIEVTAATLRGRFSHTEN